MATVKKCDRCGAIYKPNEMNRSELALDWFQPSRTPYSFDLCPRCTKEIFRSLTKYNKEKMENENH